MLKSQVSKVSLCKCGDVYSGCDTYVFPTNLVYVFFGTAIPTSSFNFIQLFFILVLYSLPSTHIHGMVD